MENNFLSIGDVAIGGSLSHEALLKVLKTTLKDKTVSKYLGGSFKFKKLLSQSNTMID